MPALGDVALIVDLAAPAGWQRGAAVRLEAVTYHWDCQLLRAVAHDAVVFWGRRRERWDDACRHLLRGAPPAHTAALPPLRAAEIAAVGGVPGEPAWWLAWMHRFAAMLRAAPQPVVLPGLYRFEPRPIPTRAVELFAAGAHGHGLHATRTLSADGQRRVALFRKRARDGTLPPALVLCTGLHEDLVIDGHDRLLAAALEGVAPRVLCVRAMGRGAGRMLLGSGAFGVTLAGTVYPYPRATGLAGGVARWTREVRERLWTLRHDPALAPTAQGLLAGLEGNGAGVTERAPPRARRGQRTSGEVTVACAGCGARVAVAPGAREVRCARCGAAQMLAPTTARVAATAGLPREAPTDEPLRAMLRVHASIRAEITAPALRAQVAALRAAGQHEDACRAAGVALAADPAAHGFEAAVAWHAVLQRLDPLTLRAHLPPDGTRAVLHATGAGHVRAAIVASTAPPGEAGVPGARDVPGARVALVALPWPPTGDHLRWDLAPWRFSAVVPPPWSDRVGLPGVDPRVLSSALRDRTEASLRAGVRRDEPAARPALAVRLLCAGAVREALALYRIALDDELALDAPAVVLRALAPWRLRTALATARAVISPAGVGLLRVLRAVFVVPGRAPDAWLTLTSAARVPCNELPADLWHRPLELERMRLGDDALWEGAARDA